jgi:hypothetical protein
LCLPTQSSPIYCEAKNSAHPLLANKSAEKIIIHLHHQKALPKNPRTIIPVGCPSSVVRRPSSIVGRPSSIVGGPSSVVSGLSSVVGGPSSFFSIFAPPP